MFELIKCVINFRKRPSNPIYGLRFILRGRIFIFGLNLNTFATATSKTHATVELTVHFLCYHWSLFSVRFLFSFFYVLNWMFVIWRRFVLTWHLDLITVIDLNCVMTFESSSSCSFFLFHYYYYFSFFSLLLFRSFVLLIPSFDCIITVWFVAQGAKGINFNCKKDRCVFLWFVVPTNCLFDDYFFFSAFFYSRSFNVKQMSVWIWVREHHLSFFVHYFIDWI